MYGSIESTPLHDGVESKPIPSNNKNKSGLVFLSLILLSVLVVSSMDTIQPSFLRKETDFQQISKESKKSFIAPTSDNILSTSSIDVRKKLAAHPSHVTTFSTNTAPVNPGYQSDVSEYPVTLSRTKSSSLPTLADDSSRLHFSTEVVVDDSQSPAILAHIGKQRSQYSDWVVMALQPDSETWQTMSVTHQMEDDFAVGYLLYDSENSVMKQGKWQIYISAVPPTEINDETTDVKVDRLFLSNSNSNIYLHSLVINRDLIVGSKAQIQALFVDKATHDVDVIPDSLESVKVLHAIASVKFPDGTITVYDLTDEDADGKYSTAFPLTQSGNHQVFIVMEGKTTETQVSVKRTQHLDVPVVSASCYLSLDNQAYAKTSETYPDYLNIFFSAQIPTLYDSEICGNENEYLNDVHLQAELWAEDSEGVMQPTSWISGMVLASESDEEDGIWYSLSLHKQWFSQVDAKQGGAIELRNIKVSDRQYHIPVSQISSITLDVRSSPVYPEKNTEIASMMESPEESNFDNELYVKMVHGPQPSEDVYLPVNKLSTELTLFLSHGYCATTSTWPIDDFTDAYVFDSGYDEGVSNDRFARELLLYSIEYGTKNQFSYIGHSQGGLAGIQLYTYYWSGLDWRSQGSGRKIQSMASPYRGSPVMISSLLDIIDSIFGYGCGGVDDLSVTGAHHWLTTIPTDRRKVLYYYNVWGGYEDCSWYEFWCDSDDTDECSWLTSFFLKDKNDGVCNGDLTNLPGGVGASGNPYDAYCHCTDMTHTSCYDWTSNNEDMDSAAARP